MTKEADLRMFDRPNQMGLAQGQGSGQVEQRGKEAVERGGPLGVD